MAKTVIRKEWFDNIEALIRQKAEPVLTMVADYEAGKTIRDIEADDVLVAFLRGHGTRIEAAVQYLQENHKQVKKTARKKRVDKEVK